MIGADGVVRAINKLGADHVFDTISNTGQAKTSFYGQAQGYIHKGQITFYLCSAL